jgi:glycosyltransferase involved in cell wall biosynthesis
MVACFKPQKAPQDFIKLSYLAGRDFPGVKFILVGDGVLRASIEEAVKKFRLTARVKLTGWRRDIPDILRVIDVFVLTSLWEGLPVCVLEAMLSGKPVVATDTGGVAEVVFDGETGFLCRPRDVEGMARKLALLLRDEGLRKRIGANARNYLENNFSQENTARDTLNLYTDCLGCKAHANPR